MNRYLLLTLFILLWVYQSGYSQTQLKDNSDYRIFESYFGDLLSDSLLSENSFTSGLYPSDSINEKIYAIGKINNHKGNDLFIIRKTITYGKEYDDRDLDFTALLIYKDGNPINGIESELILENFSASDGGVMEQTYNFEADTTISITTYRNDCCSSSGFSTSIENNAIIRFEIDSVGTLSLIRIDKCIFSSPFFHIDHLDKMQQKNDTSYPTIDDEYQLQIDNWIQSVNVFEKDIRLSFCVISCNGKTFPQFTSHDKDGNSIDTYTVGSPSNLTKRKSDDLTTSPIIIQTSDGYLELTAKGEFKLNQTTICN